MIPIRLFLAAALCLLAPALAADAKGLLDLSTDTGTGKLILSFDTLPAAYLYVPGLQSGVGSNDLGLDRGLMDRTRLVRFERFGNRVLLLEENLSFRAGSDSDAERRAVSEAFASSALAGFEILEPDDGPVRIDLDPLLLSDVMRTSALITELEQGTFEMDPERSAIDTAGVRNFPQNTLIPVVVTFKGVEPGTFIEDVTPTPDSMTVRVTHQFIELPDGDYRPRRFHPRSGYFSLRYRDYAVPLGKEIEQRLIYRHSLKPGETLTYYVDSGTPEPIRSALLEGASWWSEAFAAAGFENGFRVDVLPAGADPLDVRFHVIQWVHRATRGWSYGWNVSDPRSGEIIKGHVSLGSLRVRQDQMIAEALTAPFTAEAGRAVEAQRMALARLRQLSAHEVGHTLGIDHNFAASFSGDASVMDYPHPYLYLDDSGRVRLDRAYREGVSPWDILAVRYGYSKFEEGQEPAGLVAILNEARQRGILFIGDQDARVPGSAHPTAHLWDNGGDVLMRLNELVSIRRAGLENFSPAVIPAGMPLSEMERRLVPVYLLHRYQLAAAAKLLGGLHYDYGVRGEDSSGPEPVDASRQRAALDTVAVLMKPETLALPPTLRHVIPPPALEYPRDREFFPGATGAPFDHLAPARAGADLVIRELLQPQRLARVAEQHALDPDLPGIDEVMDTLMAGSWEAGPPSDPYLRAISEETNWRVLRGLMKLSADPEASDRVRAAGTAELIGLAHQLEKDARRRDPTARAARHEISKFLERQPAEISEASDPAPPGSPIGGA